VTTIAILATGEMGAAVGRVLKAGGAGVVTSLEGRSARTAGLARSAGIEDAGSLENAVAIADVFLSIVPPANAAEVGTAVEGALASRSRPLLYVDFNAISPHSAVQIGRRVSEAGATFVDGGIIGFPPRPGPQATRFWVSGEAAPEAQVLAEHGLDVREAGPRIGQASTLKMCYAAMTKGLTAIATESFVTASAADLTPALLAELELSQAALLRWLEHMVTSSPPKAHRWIREMEEIAATFAETGLSPTMFAGAADVYRFVASTAPGRETVETRRERSLPGIADVP
jgi:3-hydroxyisobutyrate dehydrogenase-like beta-hydroxyacid dehydrogenase